MRRVILVLALGAALAACGRAAPPSAEPGAAALAQCLDQRAGAEARRTACDEVLAREGLEPGERANALAQRGELKRAAGDPTGALADFNAALGIDGQLTEAQLGRADVLLQSGQLDAAEALLMQVSGRGDLSARAHYLLGALRARQGDANAALSSLDAAIAADDRNAEAFAARGGVKQAQENYEAAEQDFDAALRLDQNNGDALAGRCWVRVLRGGDLAAALRDAEAAVEAQAQNKEAQLCRGLIMLRREDWAEARAAYDAVLLNEPANAAALYGRGLARREAGEREEGRADMRRSYEFNSRIDQEFERLGVDD